MRSAECRSASLSVIDPLFVSDLGAAPAVRGRQPTAPLHEGGAELSATPVRLSQKRRRDPASPRKFPWGSRSLGRRPLSPAGAPFGTLGQAGLPARHLQSRTGPERSVIPLKEWPIRPFTRRASEEIRRDLLASP